jgi:hypothetical protein
VWVISALAGKKTAVYQATQMFPIQVDTDAERKLVEENLCLFDFLGDGVGSDRVVDFDGLEVFGKGRYGLKIEDSEFVLEHVSYNSIRVTGSGGASSDMGVSVSRRINLDVQSSGSTYWCYLAWLDGSLHAKDIKLYYSRPGRVRSNRNLGPVLDLLPPPVPGGAFSAYQDGDLGVPLSGGGDGQAERLYIDTILASLSNYQSSVQTLRGHFGVSELEFYYIAVPDEGLHHWAGELLDEVAGHPVSKNQWFYWSLMEELMTGASRLIEQVLFCDERDGPFNLFLTADHGFETSCYYFYVNEVLAAAGLLNWKDRYTIDLSRTQILCPNSGTSMLKVNRVEYKGGIVSPEDVEGVIFEATRALQRVCNPDDGQFIIRNIWGAEVWTELGTGGPRGGDLYLELEECYSLSSWSNYGSIVAKKPPVSRGDHQGWPLRSHKKGSLMVYTRGRPFSLPAQAYLPQIGATVLQDLGIELPGYMRSTPFERQGSSD